MHLAGESETLALGAMLAPALQPGIVIHLCGDLGSGKTTVVRGMLRSLGYEGNVKSPTYTLVELYSVSRLNFYHFDFYRFNDAEEYLDAGLDEYFHGRGVCVVEWPERAGSYMPAPDLRIELTFEVSGRRALVQAHTDKALPCLSALDAATLGSGGHLTAPG